MMQGRHLLAKLGSKTFKVTSGPFTGKLSGQISLDSSTGFLYKPDFSIVASLKGPDNEIFADISYTATATFTYTLTISVSGDAEVWACLAGASLLNACS